MAQFQGRAVVGREDALVLVGYCHHLIGRDIAVHDGALSDPEGFLGATLSDDEFSILKLDRRSLQLFLDKLRR